MIHVTEWHNGVEVITFFVDDLDRATEFYRDTFGLVVEYVSKDSVVLDCGNLGLNLIVAPRGPDPMGSSEAGSKSPGARLQITIDVDDVDAVCDDLKSRGLSLLSGPTDQPGGYRNAILADPDGYVWEIAQQLTHAAAAPPRLAAILSQAIPIQPRPLPLGSTRS